MVNVSSNLPSRRPTSRPVASVKCFPPKGRDKNERQEIRRNRSLTRVVSKSKARLKARFNELSKDWGCRRSRSTAERKVTQEVENEVIRLKKKQKLVNLFSGASIHQVITTPISQHLKLKKGQASWPFQKVYYSYLQLLLLGFWQKNCKPWKWLAQKTVFPKNKQCGNK